MEKRMTVESRPDRLTRNMETLVSASAWAVFIVIACWAFFFVPMNMDEALCYHPLACADYPFASFNTFRDPCTNHNDLSLFGLTLPMTFLYIGHISSVLYSPFYYLFHSPAGQYVYGLLGLLLFAWQLSRLSKKTYAYLPLILAFFPFTYQFIHDTGPLKIPFLVFSTLALLFRHTGSRNTTGKILFSFLFAALILLACYDKIFFVFLLPSLFFFVPAYATEKESWTAFWSSMKASRLVLVLTPLLVGAGVGLLLSATGLDGKTYLSHLQGLDDSKSRTVEQFFGYLYSFTAYWPAYAHRMFEMRGIPNAQDLFLTILTIAYFAACCFLCIRHSSIIRRPRSVLLFLSCASMIGTFLVFRNVWAGHHFVFLWIPLLALFLDLLPGLNKRRFVAIVACYLLLNLASLLVVAHIKSPPHAALDRQIVFDYFQDNRRAGKSIIHFMSWGGYFIQSLYGPKTQLVTYSQALDSNDARKLLALSQQTGRTLYIVCLREETAAVSSPWPYAIRFCDKDFLENTFGNALRFREALPAQRSWLVFEGVAPH
jgi:hypothetical protein